MTHYHFVSAQINTEINNPNYDNKFISYGFLVGIHTSSYQLKYSEEFFGRNLDSLYSISPKWSTGFSVGFILNLNVSEFLDFRVTPKLSLFEHRLEYARTGGYPFIEELVETSVIELPLLFKYKSERRGNFRMYMVGGIKPAFEASGKNDIDEISKENININPFNLSLELGFGLDMYFPFFKLSPEIRFSRGALNVLGDRNVLSEGINRLNTNTVFFYLMIQ